VKQKNMSGRGETPRAPPQENADGEHPGGCQVYPFSRMQGELEGEKKNEKYEECFKHRSHQILQKKNCRHASALLSHRERRLAKYCF